MYSLSTQRKIRNSVIVEGELGDVEILNVVVNGDSIGAGTNGMWAERNAKGP